MSGNYEKALRSGGVIAEMIRDARNQALEEAAKVADRRAAICRDAQKLGPETLPRIEIHTALEAEHIAAAIREKIK